MGKPKKRKLRPIREYLNDKGELIEQMFASIPIVELKNMVPINLQGMPLHELKAECLVELLAMSNGDILSFLEGKTLRTLTSSESEESLFLVSDEEESSKKKEEKIVKRAKEDVDSDRSLSHKEKKKKKRKSDEIELKSKKKKKADTDPVLPSTSKKALSSKESSSKKKSAEKVSKGKQKEKPKESDDDVVIIEDDEVDGSEAKKEEKSLLDLLELEMRARAIKALLKTEDDKEKRKRLEEYRDEPDDLIPVIEEPPQIELLSDSDDEATKDLPAVEKSICIQVEGDSLSLQDAEVLDSLLGIGSKNDSNCEATIDITEESCENPPTVGSKSGDSEDIALRGLADEAPPRSNPEQSCGSDARNIGTSQGNKFGPTPKNDGDHVCQLSNCNKLSVSKSSNVESSCGPTALVREELCTTETELRADKAEVTDCDTFLAVSSDVGRHVATDDSSSKNFTSDVVSGEEEGEVLSHDEALDFDYDPSPPAILTNHIQSVFLDSPVRQCNSEQCSSVGSSVAEEILDNIEETDSSVAAASHPCNVDKEVLVIQKLVKNNSSQDSLTPTRPVVAEELKPVSLITDPQEIGRGKVSSNEKIESDINTEPTDEDVARVCGSSVTDLIINSRCCEYKSINEEPQSVLTEERGDISELKSNPVNSQFKEGDGLHLNEEGLESLEAKQTDDLIKPDIIYNIEENVGPRVSVDQGRVPDKAVIYQDSLDCAVRYHVPNHISPMNDPHLPLSETVTGSGEGDLCPQELSTTDTGQTVPEAAEDQASNLGNEADGEEDIQLPSDVLHESSKVELIVTKEQLQVGVLCANVTSSKCTVLLNADDETTNVVVGATEMTGESCTEERDPSPDKPSICLIVLGSEEQSHHLPDDHQRHNNALPIEHKEQSNPSLVDHVQQDDSSLVVFDEHSDDHQQQSHPDGCSLNIVSASLVSLNSSNPVQQDCVNSEETSPKSSSTLDPILESNIVQVNDDGHNDSVVEDTSHCVVIELSSPVEDRNFVESEENIVTINSNTSEGESSEEEGEISSCGSIVELGSSEEECTQVNASASTLQRRVLPSVQKGLPELISETITIEEDDVVVDTLVQQVPIEILELDDSDDEKSSWTTRWLESDNVKKVVKTSKMLMNLRKKLMSLKKSKTTSSGKTVPVEKCSPKLIGSVEEYHRLVRDGVITVSSAGKESSSTSLREASKSTKIQEDSSQASSTAIDAPSKPPSKAADSCISLVKEAGKPSENAVVQEKATAFHDSGLEDISETEEKEDGELSDSDVSVDNQVVGSKSALPQVHSPQHIPLPSKTMETMPQKGVENVKKTPPNVAFNNGKLRNKRKPRRSRKDIQKIYNSVGPRVYKGAKTTPAKGRIVKKKKNKKSRRPGLGSGTSSVAVGSPSGIAAAPATSVPSAFVTPAVDSSHVYAQGAASAGAPQMTHSSMNDAYQAWLYSQGNYGYGASQAAQDPNVYKQWEEYYRSLMEACRTSAAQLNASKGYDWVFDPTKLVTPGPQNEPELSSQPADTSTCPTAAPVANQPPVVVPKDDASFRYRFGLKGLLKEHFISPNLLGQPPNGS